MGRSSPQGLTASDFHHPSFVNPVDVFPTTKSRLATRAHGYRSPIRGRTASLSPSPLSTETHRLAYWGPEEGHSNRSSGALNCCVRYDGISGDGCDNQQGFGNVLNCCDEAPPLHNSPSPMDCDDCVDDCDDCVEEHLKFNLRTEAFVDDCEECKHEQCTEGQPCKDNCDECDFSCFDCIDWNEFERDKSLGLSFSVPLLGDNGFTGVENGLPEAEPLPDENDLLNFTSPDSFNLSPGVLAPPLDLPMHHQCFDHTAPYWNTIAQSQLCNGISELEPTQQYPLPPFGLEFGCHPATAHQHIPVATPTFSATTTNSLNLTPAPASPAPAPAPAPARTSIHGPLNDTKELASALSAPNTSRACQWLMPCGTVCGASFASATDLKKHLKAVHLMKGVTKCAWEGCESAGFTSEAALTGHISKKHLAPLLAASAAAAAAASASSAHNSNDKTGGDSAAHLDQGGPFKCTYPGCPKSFMYKQVRDEHVASCHNGNKMYCHICGQYLNGEGSNFKRHMATHRPKHQHMLCKFHGLGCKRRFPRLDNLRRHEACCKFGKKAGLVGLNGDRKHAHHHHHHLHTTDNTNAAKV